MHTIRLIRYFFYLASNWNLSIAWHIVSAEIKGEKKYGIDTTGADELKSLADLGIDTSHATIYMPASYDLLENIFEELKGEPAEHFIDFGCGKGRVLCVAAWFHFNKLTGIDISKAFCDKALKNLQLVAANRPALHYTIKNNDAFYFSIPQDADCLFFFNPFDEVMMSGVLANIFESLGRNPRAIQIVYFNPVHKKLFTENGFEEVYHVKKLKYLEASILKYKPN